MVFQEAPIKGIWIITPRILRDERGYFMESFLKELFNKHIGPIDFVQENESMSRFGLQGDFITRKTRMPNPNMFVL